MKKLKVFLFVGFLSFNMFSQQENRHIRITKDLELIKVSENTYIHVSYAEVAKLGRVPANGLVLISQDKAFLFNTPWNDSLTEDLVSWLRNSMKLKIVGFIPNHWHSDCMGGLAFLQKQDVESYANQLTIEIAKAKNLPVPTHGFKDSLQLQVGHTMIECYYLGAAHSKDNIVVWIPSEQILFAGCMVKSINSTDLGNTADGDLKAYPNTLNKLLAKFPQAGIVIPGHGSFGGIELIKHTQQLLSK